MNKYSLLMLTLLIVACQSQSNVLPTQTSTFTPTSTATLTPTVVPLTMIDGHLFFDKNGNGLWEDGEPPIMNFEVCISSKSICVNTNEGGYFVFNAVAPEGAKLWLNFIDPNKDNPSIAYRFINLWKEDIRIDSYEVDSFIIPEQNLHKIEIYTISKGLEVIGGLNYEVGLSQGFLTFPVDCSSDYWLISYTDIDYKIGSIHNFADETLNCLIYGRTPGTCDNHQGIDWGAPIGTPIFTAAPGKVIGVSEEGEKTGPKQIRILHDLHGMKFATDYAHNSYDLVKEGDFVERGQIIGLVGNTGTQIPHLHFNIWKADISAVDNSWIFYNIFNNDAYPKVTYPDGVIVPAVEDPFRNIKLNGSYSLWTVDNEPQCVR